MQKMKRSPLQSCNKDTPGPGNSQSLETWITTTCTRAQNSVKVSSVLFQSSIEDNMAQVLSLAYSPQRAIKVYNKDTFQGSCVYSGVEFSVIGTDQARSYHKMMWFSMQLSPSSLSFKFGDCICNIDGVTYVRVPVSDNHFISFKANVIKAYIQMLIGLDQLRKHQMILDFHVRRITHKSKK